MNEKLEKVVATSMIMPISEDGAKKVLGGFYRWLWNSSNKKLQELWKDGIEKIDVLAKWLVKTNCERILENEQSNR